MNIINQYSQFSKNLFWDTSINSIDFDKYKLYVLDKVMNHGLWNDFLQVMSYYGKAKVKEEVVKLPYLKKDVLNFLCFLFNLQPTDFICYTRRRSQEKHWNF